MCTAIAWSNIVPIHTLILQNTRIPSFERNPSCDSKHAQIHTFLRMFKSRWDPAMLSFFLLAQTNHWFLGLANVLFGPVKHGSSCGAIVASTPKVWPKMLKSTGFSNKRNPKSRSQKKLLSSWLHYSIIVGLRLSWLSYPPVIIIIDDRILIKSVMIISPKSHWIIMTPYSSCHVVGRNPPKKSKKS